MFLCHSYALLSVPALLAGGFGIDLSRCTANDTALCSFQASSSNFNGSTGCLKPVLWAAAVERAKYRRVLCVAIRHDSTTCLCSVDQEGAAMVTMPRVKPKNARCSQMTF